MNPFAHTSPVGADPAKPAAKGRLHVVFDALRDMVLGETDPSPATQHGARRQSRDAIDVELLPAKSPKGALVANALAEAIGQFRYEEVLPHRDYSPEDVYQVHQVCIIETPENVDLLANFSRQGRDQRSRVVKKVFAEFPEFDTGALADVRIVKAATHALDPVTIIASSGAQRAQIAFEFHGEFVDASSLAASKPVAIEKSQAQPPSRVGTVLPPEPAPAQAAKPSRIATVLPPGSSTDAAPKVAMTLHIQEPGKPARKVDLCAFPCRIGRSEDSDVVIDTANISRTHMLILRDPTTGHFRVVDQSKVGTLVGTRAIAKGDEVTLVDGQVLTLAPGETSNPVTIRIACPAPMESPSLISRAMALQPLVAAALVPPVSRKPAAATVLARPAQRAEPTMYLDNIAVKPIARLHMVYASGQTQTHDIEGFPFEIGREPEQPDNTFGIHEGAAKVSRQHLRIDRLQAGVFSLHNLAVGANGTYLAGEKLPARFTLEPSQPGQAQPLLLGDKTLNAQAVALHLEVV